MALIVWVRHNDCDGSSAAQYMNHSLLFFAIIGPASFVAGFIRGFTGFGGPLFLLPILNFFMLPAVSASTVVWVDVFANVRLVPDARRESSLSIVAPMVLGTVIAMPLGIWFLLHGDPVMTKRVIGGAILLAAIALATGWRYRHELGRAGFGAVGAAGGLVMGATAIGALPALVLNGGKHTARQNRANFVIWLFFAELIFLALVSFGKRLEQPEVITVAILAPIYLLGAYVGIVLHRRVSDRTVRRAVLAVIFVIALTSVIA